MSETHLSAKDPCEAPKTLVLPGTKLHPFGMGEEAEILPANLASTDVHYQQHPYFSKAQGSIKQEKMESPLRLVPKGKEADSVRGTKGGLTLLELEPGKW